MARFGLPDPGRTARDLGAVGGRDARALIHDANDRASPLRRMCTDTGRPPE